MAGLHTLLLLTLMLCLSVYCHETREEQEYSTNYLDDVVDAEIDDLLEQDALRKFVNGFHRQRQKKDPCNIAAGLSGPCNVKDAIKAVRVNQFVERFGRRKRDVS